MSRKTTVNELQTEEVATGSPLRRSTRTTNGNAVPAGVTTRRNSQTLDSDVPAKATRSRRTSTQSVEETVENKPTTRSKRASNLAEEDSQKEKTTPARRGRKPSITSESSDKETEKPKPVRGRRTSRANSEDNEEEKPQKTAPVRNRRGSATIDPEPEVKVAARATTRRRSSATENLIVQEVSTPTRRTTRGRKASTEEVFEEVKRPATRGRKASTEEVFEEVKRPATRGRKASTEEVFEEVKKPAARGRKKSIDQEEETKVEEVGKPITQKSRKLSSDGAITTSRTPGRPTRRASVEEEQQTNSDSDDDVAEEKHSPINLREVAVKLTPLKKRKLVEQVEADLDLSIINESCDDINNSKNADVNEEIIQKTASPIKRIETFEVKSTSKKNVCGSESTATTKESPSISGSTGNSPLSRASPTNRKRSINEHANESSPNKSSRLTVQLSRSRTPQKDFSTELNTTPRSSKSLSPQTPIKRSDDAQKLTTVPITENEDNENQENVADDPINTSKESTGSNKENIDLTDSVDKYVEVAVQEPIIVGRVSNVFKPNQKEYSFMEPMDVDLSIINPDCLMMDKSNILEESSVIFNKKTPKTDLTKSDGENSILRESSVVFNKMAPKIIVEKAIESLTKGNMNIEESVQNILQIKSTEEDLRPSYIEAESSDNVLVEETEETVEFSMKSSAKESEIATVAGSDDTRSSPTNTDATIVLDNPVEKLKVLSRKSSSPINIKRRSLGRSRSPPDDNSTDSEQELLVSRPKRRTKSKSETPSPVKLSKDNLLKLLRAPKSKSRSPSPHKNNPSPCKLFPCEEDDTERDTLATRRSKSKSKSPLSDNYGDIELEDQSNIHESAKTVSNENSSPIDNDSSILSGNIVARSKSVSPLQLKETSQTENVTGSKPTSTQNSKENSTTIFNKSFKMSGSPAEVPLADDKIVAYDLNSTQVLQLDQEDSTPSVQESAQTKDGKHTSDLKLNISEQATCSNDKTVRHVTISSASYDLEFNNVTSICQEILAIDDDNSILSGNIVARSKSVSPLQLKETSRTENVTGSKPTSVQDSKENSTTVFNKGFKMSGSPAEVPLAADKIVANDLNSTQVLQLDEEDSTPSVQESAQTKDGKQISDLKLNISSTGSNDKTERHVAISSASNDLEFNNVTNIDQDETHVKHSESTHYDFDLPSDDDDLLDPKDIPPNSINNLDKNNLNLTEVDEESPPKEKSSELNKENCGESVNVPDENVATKSAELQKMDSSIEKFTHEQVKRGQKSQKEYGLVEDSNELLDKIDSEVSQHENVGTNLESNPEEIGAGKKDTSKELFEAESAEDVSEKSNKVATCIVEIRSSDQSPHDNVITGSEKANNQDDLIDENQDKRLSLPETSSNEATNALKKEPLPLTGSKVVFENVVTSSTIKDTSDHDCVNSVDTDDAKTDSYGPKETSGYDGTKLEHSDKAEALVESESKKESTQEETKELRRTTEKSPAKHKKPKEVKLELPKTSTKCADSTRARSRHSLDEFTMTKLNLYFKPKGRQIEGSSCEEESDEDISETEKEYHEFIDDMAEEGEEDTPSEDSNQIIDEGESVGFSDSEGDKSEDDYDENDSFICSDEESELLSGEDFDLDSDKPKKSRIIDPNTLGDGDIIQLPKKNKKKETPPKKRSRIINISDSSSEDETNVGTSKIKVQESDSKLEEKGEQDSDGSVIIMEESRDELNKVVEEVFTASVVENTKKNIEEIEKPQVQEGNSVILIEDVGNNESISATALNNSLQRHNRRSSLSIQENIFIDGTKDPAISKRINTLVESFCSTVKKGEIALNLSLEYEDIPEPPPAKENDKTESIQILSSVKICPGSSLETEDEPQQEIASGRSESENELSTSVGHTEDLRQILNTKRMKRRLSKSLTEVYEDEKKTKRRKKNKKKNKKSTSEEQLGKEKQRPDLSEISQTGSFSLMNQLITDVKNRPRRVLKPTSSAVGSSWVSTMVSNLKPSTTAATREEMMRVLPKLHPKDFRNLVLSDPKRVKRLETKTLMKKKGAFL